MLRFHIPLIEPDRRVERIRLSEEASRGRTRMTVDPLQEPDQAELKVQRRVREPFPSLT